VATTPTKTPDFPGHETAQKLGIAVVTPDVAVRQLILAWHARMPVCLIGATGQGKSAVCAEAARELAKRASANLLSWKVPTELHNWKVIAEYERIYGVVRDRGMQSGDVPFELLTTNPSTKDAFDYVGLPRVNDVTGEQSFYRPRSIPTDPLMLGIWQITEMNRPVARQVIRPLLDVFQSRAIDEHVIPPGINIVADFNHGDIYDTEELLDPFFMRRASFLFVRNDFASWQRWMAQRQMGALVTEFLLTKPDLFDDDQARRNGKVYTCAATWTRVQELLNALATHAPVTELLPLISGMVGISVATELLDYIRVGSRLRATDILSSYSKVQGEVLKLLREGHGVDYVPVAGLAALEALVGMSTTDPMYQTSLRNYRAFLKDMPQETLQALVTAMHERQTKGVSLGTTESMDSVLFSILQDSELQLKLSQLRRAVVGN